MEPEASVKFRVQDKEFQITEITDSAPGNLATRLNGTFSVCSVPRDYTVSWRPLPSVPVQVTSLLDETKGNLLFADEKVFGLHCEGAKIVSGRVLKAAATEELKTMAGVLKLVDFLAASGFTKKERLIVMGGGIIQDVGAFAAACYKRGIRWTYLPTTLLSMSDSCIGAKAGINHNGAKNQLGLFSAPAEVIIKPQFLVTLPKSELFSGMGEILKLHIIGGPEFLEFYIANHVAALNSEEQALRALIFGALGVKRAVIEVDEFEQNYRKCLNYGHTIGHALEALSGYRITHGQAVVMGMAIANELSTRRKLLSSDVNERLRKILLGLLDRECLGCLKSLEISVLADLLRKDKKTSGGTANFVFIRDIGDTVFVPLEINDGLIAELADAVAGV